MDAGYVFRTEWRLPGPPERAYAVLSDVAAYPSWWPQVRRARRLDDVSGELTCRSLLPYDVVLVLHRDVEDPAAGILRARMTGDLTGSTQWTVTADNGGCLAVFDEQVKVGNRMLRAGGRLFRPALRLNHDLMMRAGEKGLRAHLADGAE